MGSALSRTPQRTKSPSKAEYKKIKQSCTKNKVQDIRLLLAYTNLKENNKHDCVIVVKPAKRGFTAQIDEILKYSRHPERSEESSPSVLIRGKYQFSTCRGRLPRRPREREESYNFYQSITDNG